MPENRVLTAVKRGPPRGRHQPSAAIPSNMLDFDTLPGYGVFAGTKGACLPGDTRSDERNHMKSATITDRTLEIDGMSGDACVKKVTGALKDVQGVSTRSVKVGAATIEADQAGCEAACAAITQAGYKSRSNARTDEANDASRAAPKTTMSQKDGHDRPSTPARNPDGGKVDGGSKGDQRPTEDASAKRAEKKH